MPEIDRTVVDVAFDVRGTSLPVEHAWPLLRAVEALLTWLPGEALAAIHPLRTTPTEYGVVLLAQRAKLVLRLPAARLPDALLLQHATLDVGDSALHVGAGTARTLRPSATLSAQRVASGAGDEGAFEADIADTLQRIGVAARYISGRRRGGEAGGRKIAGFALALHGLGPADSMRIQCEGIGSDRRLGWGVFVPAKAIVLVDE
ncbi:MAG: type I-MYXAN CRISPR-associated protein Cas6/Cmx6 [Betaproteobacteria bacterium]